MRAPFVRIFVEKILAYLLLVIVFVTWDKGIKLFHKNNFYLFFYNSTKYILRDSILYCTKR